MDARPFATKIPWAPAPRAWTTRSGIRSWSKWVIFSRRWWSCSRTGPRGPAFSEWSVERSRAPCEVVRYSPCCALVDCGASVGAPVGPIVAGPLWEAFGPGGGTGFVGSSTEGFSTPGPAGGVRSVRAPAGSPAAGLLFVGFFVAMIDSFPLPVRVPAEPVVFPQVVVAGCPALVVCYPASGPASDPPPDLLLSKNEIFPLVSRMASRTESRLS